MFLFARAATENKISRCHGFIINNRHQPMYGQIVSQICDAYSDVKIKHAPIDSAVLSFFNKRQNSSKLLILNEFYDENLDRRLDAFRELFKACLLFHFSQMSSQQLEHIQCRYYELAATLSSDSQLEIIYLLLCAHILGLTHDKITHVHQLNNGIFPLSRHGYWNLFKYPYIHLHAEFAILILIYGKLAHQPKWITQAIAAAKWHMNLVNSHYLPFRSLFSNFQFSNYFEVVAWQGVFLNLAALASNDPEMAFVAKKHLVYLQESFSNDTHKFPVALLLILNLTDQLFPQQLTPIEPALGAVINCSDLPLMGRRHPKLNVISTLAGCNSSLGSLQFADVEIVGFGPQKGHLADPQFFGTLPQRAIKDLYQDYQSDQQYCLQATLGLPSSHSNSYFKTWQHSTSWLKTKLQLQDDILNVQIQPISIDSKFYFTFYIRAEQCLIKGQKKFLFHSLEQFDGMASNVAFLSETKMLTIKPSFEGIGMKIIPLEGKVSFWGANFLLAYVIDTHKGNFQWKITAENR